MGPGKPFDTSCINWNDEGKGHLIRIFGGKKRTYKTVLSDIPEKRPRTDNIVFPDHLTPWNIPDMLFDTFIEHFKRSHKKRVKTSKRYHQASKNFTGTYLNLPCIKKILEGLQEGQRNAGAHVLAIACRLDGKSKEEAKKIILNYAKTCSQENISESEYIGWVNWIYSEKKTFWNCRFCKDLELCTQECTFREAAFKDIFNFLQDSDVICKIDKILGKRIKKDRKNRMLIFLVCLSAYGCSPLNLFLKGESSIGKTHIAKTVAEYFPEEDVWFIGDMSPKALIHEHGEYKDGKVYVSLQNKILVFMETPRKETLEMLKPILSHDRTEIEYKIADKRASGQLGTKRVIICGWPATLFCTTNFTYLEELSTRSMLTTPEVTEAKIAEVLKYKGLQYSRPWLCKEDEPEKLLKEALKTLKSGVNVCVPYADELALLYERNEPRVMRDFEKLMELIRMSAFLHQKQREFFEVVNTQEVYIIANEYDYWVGRLLFEAVRKTTITGIPQPVIDFYAQIIEKIEGTISYRSMRERFVQVHKKPISRTNVRNKFVEPLESIGWLSRDRDPIDGRRVIFEKCKIESENEGTMGDYEASYFKGIFPEEELKEYVHELENIWNKKTVDTTLSDCTQWDSSWFYTEKVPYFLEQNNQVEKGTKDESSTKYKSSGIPHNLGETKEECGMEKNELIDQYDEGTVLLQIPQDDTEVGKVVEKFKDKNKVVDTIVALKEKNHVIAGVMDGQSYIRRLTGSQKKDSGDRHNPGVNTWRCAMCGKKFQAQNPYQDKNDNAICRDCWKKVTDT
jgi:hypothetical protein